MWRFEVFKDEAGGWRWRLVQCNALIVAESPRSFVRRGDAKQAALSARADIYAADVIVL